MQFQNSLYTVNYLESSSWLDAEHFTTYVMSIIVSNCQHCEEQQFRTLSCVHYTIFSVVKSNLFIRAQLLDSILVTEKTTRTPHVHLIYYKIQASKLLPVRPSIQLITSISLAYWEEGQGGLAPPPKIG